MKKNVGKKFRLMALLTSLTLVLWGGVTACSNGSDDDGTSTVVDANQTSDNEDDEGKTTTLPTAIKLIDFESGEGNYDSTKRETEMTKSATDGIWTCKLTVPRQWPNFNVVATVKGEEIWYGKGGELKLDTPLKIATDGDQIWCNIGADNVNKKFSVTVNFTAKEEPTIKIELAE